MLIAPLIVSFTFRVHAGPMSQLLQMQNWPAAEALARTEQDPLAVDLVRYARMQAPGQASAAEIGSFLAAHGDWPAADLLRRRLADAVVQEQDPAQVLQDCRRFKPGGAAVLRCADAERNAGQASAGAWLARQAWLDGVTDEPDEREFQSAWGGLISAEEQWRRFDRLDWAASQAVDRQAARLDAPRRALAAARLAFRHNDTRAMDFLSSVPAPLRADPALILEQARWLRGKDAAAVALALWRAAGVAAEQAAPPDRRPAFWTERDRLARLILAMGDADGAYFLADDTEAGADQAPDALFLAGWIALRRLHDPVRATAKFQALAAQSPAVITQGRAWYWLARATSDDAAANHYFAKSAAFPTSYYGQLAALRIGSAAALNDRIGALRDPVADSAASAALAARDLTRAATLFMKWGDAARARSFLLREAQSKQEAPVLALVARHALNLGLADAAVATARLAGRQGIMLARTGWPRPYAPPVAPGNVDPALVLALMRQESSFDAGIISHAGAVGLMQLMPDTARQAGANGEALTDPGVNMRLGENYLKSLLVQFNFVTPYALAAYNAGPNRARAWIAANGDAAAGGGDKLGAAGGGDSMLDWIELIPFAETRNYVQRVLENRVIYAAPP